MAAPKLSSPLTLMSPSTLSFGGKIYTCASGKGGIKENKVEGDGATPVGTFSLKRVFYRPDRFKRRPTTELEAVKLTPEDGWCDDPKDEAYNTLVKLPYSARHEKLWREDDVYDVIIELGYNDDPIVPEKGSAIFIHIAREGYKPTEGCIALKRKDLLEILKHCQKKTTLEVIIPR